MEILHKYLGKTALDHELIIIDPYFYPDNYFVGYANFIVEILAPYLPVLVEIKVVTRPRYNAVIRAQVEADLKVAKPGLVWGGLDV